jgi:hypothetical protein
MIACVFFMKKYWILLLFLVGMSQATFSQNKDTLFLNNQSPIIGELKRIKYGNILFKADELGNLDVNLKNIRTIRAYGYGYRIQTADREFLLGVFKPHQEPGKVFVYDGFENKTLLIRDLNDVQLIHQNFFRRMEGRVGAGYSYTKSSEIGRWNGDLILQYDTENLDTDLRGSIILTQEEGVLSRERESLQLISTYYFSPDWFGFAMGNYQRNLELGITRRLQQGLGLGILVLQHKRGSGNLKSGIVINQEFDTEGLRNNNLYEIPVIFDVTFFKLRSPKIIFSTNQTIFIGMTQQGRYRNDGETRINWTIVNNIDLGLNFYNNFDNQPPIFMGATSDYGLVFSIGYVF